MIQDITLKRKDAQKSMMAAFGTKSHAVWQRIVREYEGKEKATTVMVAIESTDEEWFLGWEQS